MASRFGWPMAKWAGLKDSSIKDKTVVAAGTRNLAGSDSTGKKDDGFVKSQNPRHSRAGGSP